MAVPLCIPFIDELTGCRIKKKKRFIEHTNTADIWCTSNVWGQINLDAWWGFDSTSHRLKHNLAKCNNTNNTNIQTRSDFEKHLTIKNCDETFLKIILRLKNC